MPTTDPGTTYTLVTLRGEIIASRITDPDKIGRTCARNIGSWVRHTDTLPGAIRSYSLYRHGKGTDTMVLVPSGQAYRFTAGGPS